MKLWWQYIVIYIGCQEELQITNVAGGGIICILLEFAIFNENSTNVITICCTRDKVVVKYISQYEIMIK